MSPGAGLRPTPPPLFRPQGHSQPRPTCVATHTQKRGAWLSGKSAIRSPTRPAGLRGEIKEEAFAAGGCRGTFAPKACTPRRARKVATGRAIGPARQPYSQRRAMPYESPGLLSVRRLTIGSVYSRETVVKKV